MRLQNRIPAVWLVISGIISIQFGAAIAKNHFHLVPPTAMLWLRLITAAVILLIMARPPLKGHSGRDWLIVLGFGGELDGSDLGDLPLLCTDPPGHLR